MRTKANTLKVVLMSLLAVIMMVSFTMFGITASVFAADNVKAEYGNGGSTSKDLNKLTISEFSGVKDFTDWFSLGYNSSDNDINSLVSHDDTDNSVIVKTPAGQQVEYRFKPDAATGNSQYGNYEVTFKLSVVKKGANHMYFGNRITWDSSVVGVDGSGFSTIISNQGKTLESWAGTSVQGESAPFDETKTVTIGYINSAMYYYQGDTPDVNTTNIRTKAIELNDNAARDGNQIFGFVLSSDFEVKISSFTYTRLDAAFDATMADNDAVNLVKDRLSPKEVNKSAVAEYANGGSTSKDLNKLTISEFASKADFTDWFSLGYNSSDNDINSLVSHDDTDNSVIVKTPAGQQVEYRLKPDAVTGNSQYGNYEVTFKLSVVKKGANHMYFGNRVTWDSSLLGVDGSGFCAIISNQGKTLESWAGTGVQGESSSFDDTKTVTVGYINSAMYYYQGESADPNATNIRTKAIELNDNAARDGNQVFGFVLSSDFEVKISSFTYTRLDAAFDATMADNDAVALVKTHLGGSAKPSKTYESEMMFNFKDAAAKETNQAFIDKLDLGQSTYVDAGTKYNYNLTENGYEMENTTENSYGVSWASMSTEQYKSSVVMFNLEVLSGNFELFVRTDASTATDKAPQGYRVLVTTATVDGTDYFYLKAESRHNGVFTDLGSQSLDSGKLSLAVVTDTITKGDLTYTHMRLYTSALQAVIDTTDEAVADRADFNAGNIAFGVRNQQTTKAKTIITKMAIYDNTENFVWPNKDFSTLQVKEKIDDMYYDFTPETVDKTQEFINSLNLIHRTQQGTIGINDNGEVAIKNSHTGQYGLTEYAFGAKNLGNYTVMAEFDVSEGSVAFAVRLPTFNNIQTNCVYLQFANNGDGSGLYLAMVKRVNNVYSCYFNSYPCGSQHVYTKITVSDSKISVQVNDSKIRYNTINEETGAWDEHGKFDTKDILPGGDFVIGLMNDLRADIGSCTFSKFAFYNGATPQENVEYNYTKEQLDAMSAAEKEKVLNDAKAKFDYDTFYDVVKPELSLAKEYDGKKEFAVGETITINVMEYISTNLLTEDLIVEELGGRGTYADGVWTYTFTKREDNPFMLSIGAKDIEPSVLRIDANVPAEPEKKGGCGGSIASEGLAFVSLSLVLGAVWIAMRKGSKYEK